MKKMLLNCAAGTRFRESDETLPEYAPRHGTLVNVTDGSALVHWASGERHHITPHLVVVVLEEVGDGSVEAVELINKAKSLRRKGETAGEYIMGLLKEGKAIDEIVVLLKEKYPDKKSGSDPVSARRQVQYYMCLLKKGGKREPRPSTKKGAKR